MKESRLVLSMFSIWMASGAVPMHNSGYDGGQVGGGGGYTDYNRGGGDFGGRSDFGGGYNDRGSYGQNVGGGGAAMGYTSSQPMSGYGPTGGAVGGYGQPAAVDYGRTDYGRTAEFGQRTDYGNRGDFPGILSISDFHCFLELSV